jgi:ATP-binding protein involved in chromosome partitioning
VDIHRQRPSKVPETDSRPVRLEVTPSGLELDWDDGHKSIFPSRFLRLNCACAGCVQELTGRPLLDPAKVPQDIVVMEFMEVGNYGVQPLWSDGHHTGIFSHNRLRAICPCGEHPKPSATEE